MNDKRLLIIEDDTDLREGLSFSFSSDGYRVTEAPTKAEGLREIRKNVYDMVLLDCNLPDGTGYEFCKWVKEQRDIPIIFLTVRDGAKDIIKGLDMGGDDYITKPFHLSVLESRIKAVLRRASKKAVHSPELSCGTIRINLDKMEVQIQGNAILLTAAEYRLLLVLMENKGKTLPRTLLLEKLWDAEGNFVNDNTLTVTMKRLREKLGQPGEIKTVRGIGYRMEDTNE